MVCNERATAEAIRSVDKRIKAMVQKIAKAPDPVVYAPEVESIAREVETQLLEARAHGGDHDSEWIMNGAPGDGPEFEAWQTSQDITTGWSNRQKAIDELRRRVQPRTPKDPDGAVTTHQEAFAVANAGDATDESDT